jgi:DNA helicase HerA-like ATPase
MSAKDGADAQPDVVAAVQQGYSFDGPALELGALVVDGKARPDAPVRIPLAMVNRHGLVAGATGTGKTKTLQLMAEQLSAAGVPVMATSPDWPSRGRPATGRRRGRPRWARPGPGSPARSSCWPSAARATG